MGGLQGLSFNAAGQAEKLADELLLTSRSQSLQLLDDERLVSFGLVDCPAFMESQGVAQAPCQRPDPLGDSYRLPELSGDIRSFLARVIGFRLGPRCGALELA